MVLIGRDRGKRCLRKYERPVCQHVLLGFDWAPVVVVIDGTASREVADMKARLIPMHGVEDDLKEEKRRKRFDPTRRVRTKLR